jgi:hypothetical protein
MRKLIFLSFVLMHLQGFLFAQVNLLGEVKHTNSGIDGVIIQVLENGSIVRTVNANKRGKFTLEIPFEHDYTLVFRAPYMIPVRIRVNTKSANALNARDVAIEVPLQMELFHRYKGLDISAYNSPIGEVKNIGTGENSFQFVPDLGVIGNVKSVNAESIKRENQGEPPIDSEELKASRSPGNSETLESNDLGESRIVENPKENAVSKNANQESDDLKFDRRVSNFDHVAEAENSGIDRQKELTIAQSSQATINNSDRESYIISSKIEKSESSDENSDQVRMIADAKVYRQTVIDSQLAESALFNKGVADKPQIVAFITEIRLQVLELNKRQLYRKVIYDYWFFELEYYYKNNQEISGKLYDEVDTLFN